MDGRPSKSWVKWVLEFIEQESKFFLNQWFLLTFQKKSGTKYKDIKVTHNKLCPIADCAINILFCIYLNWRLIADIDWRTSLFRSVHCDFLADLGNMVRIYWQFGVLFVHAWTFFKVLQSRGKRRLHYCRVVIL